MDEIEAYICKKLQEDECRLTITPMWVTRGSRPVYTAIVRGRPVTLKLKDLKVFSRFRVKALEQADCCCTLPHLTRNGKTISRYAIWAFMVKDALACTMVKD
jgi:hypothetical protein